MKRAAIETGHEKLEDWYGLNILAHRPCLDFGSLEEYLLNAPVRLRLENLESLRS